MVWTGGDATPTRIGVVDWTGMVGAVVDVEPFGEVLESQVLEASRREGKAGLIDVSRAPAPGV